MYKIQDISSFSFFFSLTSCSSSIFVECHSKNSDFSFWIQTQRKIILETKKTLFLHRRYTKYFSLAHIHFFLFVFYVWEEEVLDTAEKIVSHLKFGFLLTFKKICLTTLDWDDQLQSFFYIYTVTFGISFSIIFCDWFSFSLLFLLVLLHRKNLREKGFSKGILFRREREIWRREKWESLSWSQHQTREKVVLKLWKIYYSLEYAILQSLKIACNK